MCTLVDAGNFSYNILFALPLCHLVIFWRKVISYLLGQLSCIYCTYLFATTAIAVPCIKQLLSSNLVESAHDTRSSIVSLFPGWDR